MQIVLAAPNTNVIALGTNAINYSQSFRDVEVLGIHATRREVPFPDVLSMFRDVHHRAQELLRQHAGADVAVLFTNELISFRDSLTTRVTFSIGIILTCFRDGGGVRLITQANWIPKKFRRHINKLGDMFEGEIQHYFERAPNEHAMESAAAIWGNLQAIVDVPITEYRETVH